MNKPTTEPLTDYKAGDVVFLTMAGHDYVARNKKDFNIPTSGRIAKILEVIDWKSARGKKLLAERKKLPMWANKNVVDFKYVLMIYYPDLSTEEADGIALPELFPQYHPMADKNKKIALFEKWNKELLTSIFTESSLYKITVKKG
jgi:hypothetical protein